MTDHNEIRNVKARYREDVMRRANVLGLGVGYRVTGGQRTDEVVLSVLVQNKVARDGLPSAEQVPGSIEGIQTDVLEVGEIRAWQSPTERHRPAPGGVSIGHYQISAGTLGAIVRDRTTGDRLILSNNHVLANSNDAEAGDPIIQPGGADGGTVTDDLIARLERFCPITFGTEPGSSCGLASTYAGLGNFLAALLGSRHRIRVYRAQPQAANLVDAAVARPLNDNDVLDEILEIGAVSGTVGATLGMPVRKSGRTTGFTEDIITTIDATVSVNYGLGKTATFENQLIAGPMSAGGDSGSLVVAGDSQQAVGLLFAGSPQTTIINPIQAVLDCLNVEI